MYLDLYSFSYPSRHFLPFLDIFIHTGSTGSSVRRSWLSEVDALGVITVSRGCFERCCSDKKTPPYHSNLSFVALRNRRPTLLRAPAYCTRSEASHGRRCGYASWFL